MSDGNLTWRKSSFSSQGNCVEVGTATCIQTVHVRDTKSRERGMLTVTADTWRVFTDLARAGRFDLPSLGRTPQASKKGGTPATRGCPLQAGARDGALRELAGLGYKA